MVQVLCHLAIDRVISDGEVDTELHAGDFLFETCDLKLGILELLEQFKVDFLRFVHLLFHFEHIIIDLLQISLNLCLGLHAPCYLQCWLSETDSLVEEPFCLFCERFWFARTPKWRLPAKVFFSNSQRWHFLVIFAFFHKLIGFHRIAQCVQLASGLNFVDTRGVSWDFLSLIANCWLGPPLYI